MPEVDRIGVVVPARDEADHVGACLSALAEAARRVTVPVDVVVVVNGSLDATASLAREHGAHILELDEPGVGAARAAGVEHLVSGIDAERTWIATTDADSLVPPAWLEHHVELAAAGADAVVGTIVLPPGATSGHAAWWHHYQRGVEGGTHRHVHGANLGLHASAYAAVGGFANLVVHEDADLVRRVVAAGHCVVWTTEHPVVTSARLVGRAPSGVAADLRAASAPAG